MPRSGLLLVEDDPNDEELTCLVLRDKCQINDITVMRDGAAALAYLLGAGEFTGRDVTQQPVVVLLDLNLPKVNGLEVLKTLRADARTAVLPIVIMTSSHEDADIQRGYAYGANSYVVKPVEYVAFTEKVQQLGVFWLLANEPPLDDR